MKADLHSHSVYSDGYSTVLELVNHAKDRGIDILALTDHDSVLGCKELLKYDGDGIKLIAGIELSCSHFGETVHIVGLFKNNIIPDNMVEFSTKLLEDRKNRGVLMAQRINEIYNTNIDVDLLVKENKTITRKNIYNYLVKYSNLDIKDIDFMVSKKSKAYVKMKRLTVKEGIDLLHENNAIAILAHPCLIDSEKLSEILEFNFDGIEAKYANKKNDYNYFKNIADCRGFFISAGSDYHGDKTHGDLGDVYLEESEVKLILDKLGMNYGN